MAEAVPFQIGFMRPLIVVYRVQVASIVLARTPFGLSS
jgi:hypothetical protein